MGRARFHRLRPVDVRAHEGREGRGLFLSSERGGDADREREEQRPEHDQTPRRDAERLDDVRRNARMTRPASLFKAAPGRGVLLQCVMKNEKETVAYCRVSTYEQKRRGYGIDIQVRDVGVFAEREGLSVGRFYRDEAESGVRERREALRRLLRDCKAGKIAAVIIPSLDRLSREVRLAENLFHDFERLGVRILIADMPNYNGKDRRDVLLRQIREAIAEENRKDIIERLWKGRQERVRRGRPAGGNLAYGYRREGKAVTIEPTEAELVRRIYELAGRELAASAIARDLNEAGRARRNGKPCRIGRALMRVGERTADREERVETRRRRFEKRRLVCTTTRGARQ